MNLCNVLKGSALVRKILSMKAAEEDGKTQTEIEPVSYRRIYQFDFNKCVMFQDVVNWTNSTLIPCGNF